MKVNIQVESSRCAVPSEALDQCHCTSRTVLEPVSAILRAPQLGLGAPDRILAAGVLQVMAANH